ncbi:glycosyltransferase family 2 protein [Georgenia alba]|uniref:Glycosyltransferase family 2 protein n=1 Tax=Georgenia alba TaxID=2233858 RepID=A0ABW2Q6A0_9MICO
MTTTYGTAVQPMRSVDDLDSTRTPRVRDDALDVSVVIPTMNEALNIAEVLKVMPPVAELIVVDSESTDGTVEAVLEQWPDAVIIRQGRNGKGAAMRAGFAAASRENIVAIDADGSMDPREIPAFIAMFERGFDVVKGSRAACGGGSTDLTPLRAAGNRGLCTLYNVAFRSNMSDLCYGFIGFRRRVLPSLALYADGFEIEAQILCHAQLAGMRIAEVPSLELDRIHGETNLRTWSDGYRVLKAILRSRFASGREIWRFRDVERRESEALAGVPRGDRLRLAAPTLTP